MSSILILMIRGEMKMSDERYEFLEKFGKLEDSKRNEYMEELFVGHLESEDAFKSRWKYLVKLCHSDVNPPLPSTADDVMKIITNFKYEKLKDKYDLFKYSSYYANRDTIVGIKAYVKGELVIPSWVSFIGEKAFYSNLPNPMDVQWPANIYFHPHTVVIPKSVKAIGVNAFRGCRSIKKIIFQHEDEDEIEIYEGAFEHCEGLMEIKLPSKAKLPGGWGHRPIFFACFSLRRFVIGEWFKEEYYLSSILSKRSDYKTGSWISNKELVVHTRAKVSFKDLDLVESVFFEKGFEVSEIHANMFSGCKDLKKLNLDSVTSIGDEAFYGCSAIENLPLHDIEKIGEQAFKNCTNLKEIDFSKVRYIGKNAFKNCSSLERIELSEITQIAEGVFENCTNLKEMDFSKVRYIGKNAFKNCSSLECIELSEITQIAEGAFEGCCNLKELKFNGRVSKLIEPNIFKGCIGLKEINLPGVKVLGDKVFEGCVNLRVAVLPNLTKIKGNPFEGCNSLMGLNAEKLKEIDEEFVGVLEELTLDIPEELKEKFNLD